MIKWGEFRDGDAVFEAFLPEHDRESGGWLLRQSCNGHIIEERRVRLTWPPRFGPDVGDVAQIEAELDALITSEPGRKPPETRGKYMPTPFSPLPSDLTVLAALATCLSEFVEAARALALSDEQTRAYLYLPERAIADGLYPVAITPRRESRMLRVIALARLLERDNRAESRRAELITAVLAEDISTIGRILDDQGITPQA